MSLKIMRKELTEFLEEGFKVIKNLENQRVVLKKEDLEITFDIPLDKIISARYIHTDCNPTCKSRIYPLLPSWK